METFIGLFFIFIAFYFGCGSWLMTTDTIWAFILFKAVPAAIAGAAAFLALAHYGFIVQV